MADTSMIRRAEEVSRRKARGDMTLEQQAAIPPEERPMIFDPKRVRYLDTDVLTAAKERIQHCLETFDRCAVSYSGGKDSHVVLSLVRMVMDDMGWSQPLDVVFHDEELIPDDVIEHVMSLRSQPDRYTLHHICIPLTSKFFYLGEHVPYIQWDADREWVRPKPEGAITSLRPDNAPMSQQQVQVYLQQALGWKGKVAMFNGIRAQESLQRFRSCILVKNRYNYIMRDAESKNTWFVKPIFDWSTKDIFRFFYDHNITYCKIYDAEMFAGTPDSELRVSTPLHERAYKYLSRLRSMYPKMYEQMTSVFPGILTHERYWGDVDRYGVIQKYPKSYAGILQYIEDTSTDPVMKAKIIKAVRTTRTSKENNRRLGKFADEKSGFCYGYPLLHVFKIVVQGGALAGIQLHSNPDARMVEYERASEAEGQSC